MASFLFLVFSLVRTGSSNLIFHGGLLSLGTTSIVRIVSLLLSLVDYIYLRPQVVMEHLQACMYIFFPLLFPTTGTVAYIFAHITCNDLSLPQNVCTGTERKSDNGSRVHILIQRSKMATHGVPPLVTLGVHSRSDMRHGKSDESFLVLWPPTPPFISSFLSAHRQFAYAAKRAGIRRRLFSPTPPNKRMHTHTKSHTLLFLILVLVS